jgi:hypothetical protein
LIYLLSQALCYTSARAPERSGGNDQRIVAGAEPRCHQRPIRAEKPPATAKEGGQAQISRQLFGCAVWPYRTLLDETREN